MATSESTPTSVYKYYDANKFLIYVGITSGGVLRNRQHNSSKAWWPFVAEQAVEHFSTRDEAHVREVALIREFRPPFNTQHNPEHADLRAAYVQLVQSGRIGLTIKQVVLPGNFKRFLTLHPVLDKHQRVSFLTELQDARIAEYLRHVENTRILSLPQTKSIGKVTGVTFNNLIARISTSFILQPRERILRVVGRIRIVSLKPPVSVNFKTIQVSLYRPR